MPTRDVGPPFIGTIDPAVQAIFDALVNFMATKYPTCNAYANADPSGTTTGISASDRQGNDFRYSERHMNQRVTLSPQNASLAAGATQQFTASAANPDGTAIADAAFSWSLGVGAHGSVDANGLYTAPASVPANVTDTVTATLHDSFSAATTMINLHT